VEETLPARLRRRATELELTGQPSGHLADVALLRRAATELEVLTARGTGTEGSPQAPPSGPAEVLVRLRSAAALEAAGPLKGLLARSVEHIEALEASRDAWRETLAGLSRDYLSTTVELEQRREDCVRLTQQVERLRVTGVDRQSPPHTRDTGDTSDPVRHPSARSSLDALVELVISGPGTAGAGNSTVDRLVLSELERLRQQVHELVTGLTALVRTGLDPAGDDGSDTAACGDEPHLVVLAAWKARLETGEFAPAPRW
jgi:hypothetical protein